jgi:hypothetical protein
VATTGDSLADLQEIPGQLNRRQTLVRKMMTDPPLPVQSAVCLNRFWRGADILVRWAGKLRGAGTLPSVVIDQPDISD